MVLLLGSLLGSTDICVDPPNHPGCLDQCGYITSYVKLYSSHFYFSFSKLFCLYFSSFALPYKVESDLVISMTTTKKTLAGTLLEKVHQFGELSSPL